MFKKISVTLFILLATVSVSAQKIDAKAKALLDAVASNYKSKKNVYFKFVYGTGAGQKVTKTEPGIFYASNDLYKLKIMGVEQIFDGQKVYNISAEDEEVTVARPNGNEQMFSPLTYVEAYKKGYTVKYIGKINVNGVNADYIRMTPTTNNGIKEVRIFVNGPKKQLVKIEQFSKDNSTSVIAIQDYKENQKLGNNVFSFDKNQYKNYLITEL